MGRALQLVDAGKSPGEAAADVGVGASTVYQWLADRRRSAPAPVPVPKVVPVPRKPPVPVPKRKGKPGLELGAQADEDLDGELDDVPAVHAAEDDITAIDRLIGIVEKKLRLASEARTGPLVATLSGLIFKRAKLRPPPPPSEEEKQRLAKPLADEVLDDIEANVRAAEVELHLP